MLQCSILAPKVPRGSVGVEHAAPSEPLIFVRVHFYKHGAPSELVFVTISTCYKYEVPSEPFIIA